MTLQTVNSKVCALRRLHGSDLVNTPWLPGDLCQHWQDRSSLGTVIAVFNTEEMLVLWSREPFTSGTTLDEELTKILEQL